MEMRREANCSGITQSASVGTFDLPRRSHPNSILTASQPSDIQVPSARVNARASSSPITAARSVCFPRESRTALTTFPLGYVMVMWLIMRAFANPRTVLVVLYFEVGSTGPSGYGSSITEGVCPKQFAWYRVQNWSRLLVPSVPGLDKKSQNYFAISHDCNG